MNPAILTAVIEEKPIVRYLNSIAQPEQERAKEQLATCFIYAVLTAILPFFKVEEHQEITKILLYSEPESLAKWYKQLPLEVRTSSTETLERILLAIE